MNLIQSHELGRLGARASCRWLFAMLGAAIASALQPAFALNVSVADYGAVGDGARDDTAAIQRALDAVRQAGGGEVYFPPGTYPVSVVSQGASLRVGSSVTLRGQSAQQSVLRLNVQGRFDTLLRPDVGAVQVTVQDLGFDLNGLINPMRPFSGGGLGAIRTNGVRTAIAFHGGSDHAVRRCRFFNIASVQTIAAVDAGQTPRLKNVVIADNAFEEVGGGSLDYDHSTTYTEADGVSITGNVFSSRHGPGTLGATTAVEIHGPNQRVLNNDINGYTIGAIASGIYPFSSINQVYQSNRIAGVNFGVRIWMTSWSNTPQPVMKSILIRDNTITVDVQGWRGVPTGGGGVQDNLGSAGIVWMDSGLDTPLEDLDVINNHIRSVNIGTPPLDFSGLHNGIRFHIPGDVAPASRIRILDNRIENSPAAGLYFDRPLHGVLVSGNAVINPGSSQGGLQVGAARGIRVAGQTRDFYILDNAFVDDRLAPRMAGGIYEISSNLGNCAYTSNKVELASGASVPQFTSGPSHAGPAWIANPPPLRHDAFEGPDPGGWTPVSGTWQVQPDHAGRTGVYVNSDPAEGLTLAGEPQWKDYLFRALVSLDDARGSRSLLARVQDATHYDVFEIRPHDQPPAWSLSRREGDTVTLLSGGELPALGGSWVWLRLMVAGNRLTAEVAPGANYHQIAYLGTANDSTWGQGRIGLRTLGARAGFDEVSVFPLDGFDYADAVTGAPRLKASLHNGVHFEGIIGQTYRVEYRDGTDLPWSVLEEVSPLRVSPTTVFDPANPVPREREYQVLWQSSATPAASSVSGGRILLSGQPFFPIGVYHVAPLNVTSTEAQRRAGTLTAISGGGLNALHLDDRGDSALASLLDSASGTEVRIMLGGAHDTTGFLGTVNKYKPQGALFAWTLFDDADDGRVSLQSIADKNTRVKQADPSRITNISLTGYDQSRRGAVASYMTLCDVVRVQSYPLGRVDGAVSYGSPLKDNFYWLSEATTAAAQFNRPVIGDLQAFSWGTIGSGSSRAPDSTEERNLTYGALAAGVKGVMWYAAYDPAGWNLFEDTALWSELRALKDDISTMAPFLLNGSFTKNVATGNPECVASRWQLGNQAMILAVNLDAQSYQNVQIALTSGASNVRRFVARLRSSLSASGGWLTGTLNAAEVQTYTMEVL